MAGGWDRAQWDRQQFKVPAWSSSPRAKSVLVQGSIDLRISSSDQSASTARGANPRCSGIPRHS